MFRKLLIIPVIIILFFSIASASTPKQKRQISESGKIKSLKTEIQRVNRDLSTYMLQLDRNPSSESRSKARKLRFLTLLRGIEIKASQINSSPARKLLKDLQEVRKKVRNMDQTIRNKTLRSEVIAQSKGLRTHSRPKPNKDAASGSALISGTVTDASTSAPIPYVEVAIYEADGSYYNYGYTDSSGAYSIPVSDGTYFAITYNYDGFTDELYHNIQCEPYCNVTQGTPILVNGSATGIDFALVPPGRISGTVTDAVAGDPIENISIDIYDSDGYYRAYGYTDVAGNYVTFGALDTGDFYAVAGVYSETHIGELYQDQICPFDCNVLLGTPIAVTSGSVTTGINFTLIRGGSVSGTVTSVSSSAPISSGVIIFDANGYSIRYGHTDESGRYEAGGLPTGHYFAQTNNDEYYVDELYDDIVCYQGNCQPQAGSPISVSLGSETSGINFSLNSGGVIRGTVLDEQTLDPIPYVGIEIYDSSRNSAGYGYTDESGNYSVPGLLSGLYTALTSNYGDYLNELYDNIPCDQGCNIRNGTKIEVNAGGVSVSADFRLQKGGSIEGMLTDSSNGDPIEYSGVDIYNASGEYDSYSYTDEAGRYVAGGLSTGNYFVSTSTYGNYSDELYDDHPCPGYSCDPVDGDPVAVTVATTTTGIDFVLDPGGTISGTVTSSSTSAPISNFYIVVFDAEGNWASNASSNPDGTYIAEGLQTGTYYVIVSSFENHLDELYDNLPCAAGNCNPLDGTPVAVTLSQNTPGINFALDDGGSISGKVTDSLTSSGIEYAGVEIYDSNGNFLSYSYADISGNFQSQYPGLLTGNYFARTSTYGNYMDELFDNIPCNDGCDVLTGTPIPVMVGNNTGNVNFELDRGGSISGTVTDAASTLPIPYISVEVYDSSGVHVSYGYTDSAGNYNTYGELVTGTYYVLAYDYYGNHYTELYDNIPCPDENCDVTSGTPVSVVTAQETTGINFALDPREQCTPPAFTPSVLPGGNLGVFYNQSITLNGGVPPYELYFSGGSLPPGFSFDENTGTVSGVAVLNGVFTFSIAAEDSVGCSSYWTYTINITTGPCQFCDDFEDGVVATDWNYKEIWQETDGRLNITSQRKTAAALANPAFPGCINCTIITDFQTSGGGSISIFGWYQNRGNSVELLINEKKDRWVLKQRSGGNLVAKKKAKLSINPGVKYRVAIAFDGTNIIVTVQGQTIITMPAGASPFGTFGYQLKGTTVSFGSISVY